MLRGHEVLAQALVERGLHTMFGVMGEANMLLIDSYLRSGTACYVPAAHESGAVLMAAGYAAVSNELGLATTTHGAAVTNILTALTESVRSRTPILVITGDTPSGDWRHVQNLPQRDHVMPTGAGFLTAHSANTLGDDLDRAIHAARSELRPVVLNVPADVLSGEAAGPWIGPGRPIGQGVVHPDEADLDKAAGIAASADRPLILAGRGAATPAARTALLELAECLGAPLATTLRAKDLFAGEEGNLGLFGTLSSPETLDYINRADCLLVFGASLNRHTACEGAMLNGKAIVQCDRDPRAVGANFVVDVALIGDSVVAARKLTAMLAEAEIRPRTFRHSASQVRVSRSVGPNRGTVHGTVDLHDAVLSLERAMPADRTLVCDAGRFMWTSLPLLTVAHPYRYVHTANIGSIGLGLPEAVGAWCAARQRPVLAVVGDGGFMLGGLTEFNTAVRIGADITVAVMNDGAYGAEYAHFTAHGLDPAPSYFDWPPFADVANALGGEGHTIRHPEQLESLDEIIANRSRPLLLDFRLDRTAIEREA